VPQILEEVQVLQLVLQERPALAPERPEQERLALAQDLRQFVVLVN
jgi:hypothetical protein